MPQRVDQQPKRNHIWNTIWVTHFDAKRIHLDSPRTPHHSIQHIQQVPSGITEISQIQQMCEFWIIIIRLTMFNNNMFQKLCQSQAKP